MRSLEKRNRSPTDTSRSRGSSTRVTAVHSLDRSFADLAVCCTKLSDAKIHQVGACLGMPRMRCPAQETLARVTV